MLAQSRQVVVLRRGKDITACFRPTGEVVFVHDDANDPYSVVFPAVRVAGSLVAYGEAIDGGSYDETGFPSIVIFDMSRPDGPAVGPSANPRFIDVTSPNFDGNVQIADIVLTTRAIAWTGCVAGTTPPPMNLSSGNGCGGPGQRYVARSTLDAERPTFLDKGPSIRPTTLTLSGGNLRWRHGTRMRTARL